MELSSCHVEVLIRDDSLQTWCVIGSGGFGQIHKARHVEWGLDVAIKLLHYNNGCSSSLLREAELMRQAGSPYVLRILGVYEGCPPCTGLSTQVGLVMEFMEKGSLAALQACLSGPPPWPLSFRLAHQVALGMNYLHHLDPPLLHLDLKPSNVLLDDSLQAKLTDFGLARVYQSISKASKKDIAEEGGTLSYMPPEAFDLNYKPTKASDIYSYGILLWSIFTGEEPYASALSSIVRFRVPEGDRPLLETLNPNQAEGLRDLVDLMERCWHQNPAKRPSFLDCLPVTERVYDSHKQGINDADSDGITSAVNNLHISTDSKRSGTPVASNRVHTGPSPTQETSGGLTSRQKQREHSSPQPIKKCNADYNPSSTIEKPKTSVPLPKQKATLAASSESQGGYYQRQHSSPVPSSNNSKGGVVIHMSNVTGVQLGNNNSMYIGSLPHRTRKRNPTAPSSVNFPTAQPDIHKGPEPW
ncbi:hypothetical protein UPYG_G00236360 [Umbra pygmaea]|uniref:Protein kinase domain-containing protein n=1 Tax=Umbra pygmaea TaxID=75934 RepID=A0ABD0X288_UMBPY